MLRVVGSVTETRPAQFRNALTARIVTLVLITMFPVQHAADGLDLLTQPVVTVGTTVDGTRVGALVGVRDGAAVGT